MQRKSSTLKKFITKYGKIVQLNGKIVLVTGSTDGIGKQTAHELAKMGATVIVHGRNENRVKSTVEEIQHSVRGAKLEMAVADFSSLKQVRQLANQIQSKFSRLDVLINNAGVYMKKRMLTEDGYETTFAVNHLAHFFLANLLLEFIRKSAPARIVTVSSMVHTSAKLDFENLNAEHHFDAYGSYALSKLANVLFAKELVEQFNSAKVSSNSLHPGVIGTKMLRTAFNITGASVRQGAEMLVYLAFSPEVEKITGKYFINKQVTSASPLTEDTNIRKRFWDVSKTLVGL